MTLICFSYKNIKHFPNFKKNKTTYDKFQQFITFEGYSDVMFVLDGEKHKLKVSPPENMDGNKKTKNIF